VKVLTVNNHTLVKFDKSTNIPDSTKPYLLKPHDPTIFFRLTVSVTWEEGVGVSLTKGVLDV